MSRNYRVAFAAVELEGIFASEPVTLSAALRESWKPGTSVTRYRRQWRISRPHDREDGVLTGRIGFVRENELATLDFDESSNEFRRGQASTGDVVPFAVDTTTGRVGFQLLSGVIRPASFTGAFESLLNLSDTYQWRVRPLVRKARFDEWRASVDHVTEFNFRLVRPNPHYADDVKVEELIEDLRAQVVRVSGSGEDVDEDSDFFRQALDHTLRNYGRAVIRGERNGDESEWRSAEAGTVPAIARIESEDEQELPEEELAPLLDNIGEVLEDDEHGEDDFSTS